MVDGYDGSNTTGFASPAGDALEGPIDLSAVLDLRRPHRYPVRVVGEALRERGILPGDVLIVDTAVPPSPGRVCVAVVAGDVVLATLAYRQGGWWLCPATADRNPVRVEADAAEVWAIVRSLVRIEV